MGHVFLGWKNPGMGIPGVAQIFREGAGVQDSSRLVICTLSYPYVDLPAVLMRTPGVFKDKDYTDPCGLWLQRN